MASPRFSPKLLTSQHLQLQKQIYLKEEKFLGLPGQKKRLDEVLNGRFGEDSSLSPSPIKDLRSEFKSVNLSYKKMPTNPISLKSDSKLQQFYRSRISVATRLKEKFDLKNRSPISWLSKEDSFQTFKPQKLTSYMPNPEDLNRLSMHLNKKKVIKGMGYEKSFIFSN